MSIKPTKLSVYVRLIRQNDLNEVLVIEKESFDNPWTEDDFRQTLRRKDHVGYVAVIDDRVSGYLVYQIHADHLRIESVAIRPSDRRRGIATAFLTRIAEKAKMSGKRSVTALTRESNLPAQLLFRDFDYQAVEVLRQFYEDVGEDAYKMEYRV